MCYYCKNGVSFVNTNMARVSIDYTIGNRNNARINCFNLQGKEITIPIKLNFCPMCGDKL